MQINTTPLKAPRTYDEQIEILRTRHRLLIQNDERAKDILAQINYYRLSAYGIGLRINGTNSPYKAGTTIEQLYGLYLFDSRLRNLLLALLDPFEVELRARLAYCLAHAYGAEGYKHPANFRCVYSQKTADSEKKTVHTIVMEGFSRELKHSKNKPCVLHHKAHYGGNLPVWAAVEIFTFGMLSSLYSIMEQEDKSAVAACFHERAEHFPTKVHALSNLRNICAHNDRLYDMPLSPSVSLNKQDRKYVPGNNNRLFPLLIVLRNVTKRSDLWEWFYHELRYLIHVHPEAGISLIGFPDNWEEALKPNSDGRQPIL